MDVGFCWISKLNRSLFGFFSHRFRSAYLPTTHLLNADNKGWGQKKKITKAGRGAGPSYWLCGTKQKAPCTIQKEGERRKHQNTAAKKQNYPVCMNVCVCMNDNPAVLQPADHRLSGTPGGRLEVRGSSPLLCAHVWFFFYKVVSILSKEYADDMLRAVILIQVSV